MAEMTQDEQRKAFEAWIKSPPYEFWTARFGRDTAWPGQYRHDKVQLAWEAWQRAQWKRDAQ